MEAIKALLDNEHKEYILVYLLARETGSATYISRFFNMPIGSIRKQLKALESVGLLSSKKVGVRREYRFAENNPLVKPLKMLMKEVIESYPEKLQTRLFIYRTRPRAPGKPLIYVRD